MESLGRKVTLLSLEKEQKLEIVWTQNYSCNTTNTKGK